jgi:hypothetical protein
MNDNEVLPVILTITQLRSNPEYQQAGRLVRRLSPEDVGNAASKSDVHAALRLLIGTWERIATLAKGFDVAQRNTFFKSHPVSLMWLSLEPAINANRTRLHPGFASEFQNLHNQYQQWIKTPDGQQFSSSQQQATTALFA